MNVWHVDYIPADFVSIAYAVREAETCAESKKLIAHGQVILRQLKRRKVRMPNAEVLIRWKHSLKSFKKHCKRK